MISGAVVFYLGLCSNTAHIMKALEIGQERRGRNFIGVGRFEFRGDIGFARGPSSILSAVRSYGSGQQIDEALFAGTVSQRMGAFAAEQPRATWQYTSLKNRGIGTWKVLLTPFSFPSLPILFELLTVRDTVGKSLSQAGVGSLQL